MKHDWYQVCIAPLGWMMLIECSSLANTCSFIDNTMIYAACNNHGNWNFNNSVPGVTMHFHDDMIMKYFVMYDFMHELIFHLILTVRWYGMSITCATWLVMFDDAACIFDMVTQFCFVLCVPNRIWRVQYIARYHIPIQDARDQKKIWNWSSTNQN